MKKKVLLITPRFPYPLEKGDKLRSYSFIKELSKYFEVHLCAISTSKVPENYINEVSQYVQSIHIYHLSYLSIFINLTKLFFNSLPFQVNFYYSNSTKRFIKKVIKKVLPDVIIVQTIRVAKLVEDIKSIPIIIDFMDAFSINYLSRYMNSLPPLQYIFKIEAKRVRKYEEKLLLHNFKFLVISEKDKKWIEDISNWQKYPNKALEKDYYGFSAKVSQIPNINKCLVIKNGVDFDNEFFKNSITNESCIYDILFTGNLGYGPNIDAVYFLIKKILPLLPLKISILIAGASPSLIIRWLSLKAKNRVSFLFNVPNIRSVYTKAKVYVAPIFLGSGMLNKILEACASGLPTITTLKVASAFGFINEKHLLIANTPEEFANAIITLLNSPEKRNYLAKNAMKFIIEHHKWDKCLLPLIEEINNL